jgi:endonuclease/exonuclease/phosphatase family metal-dependent hydrolase
MKSYGKFRVALLVALVSVFSTCASVAATNVKVMTYNVDEGTDFDAIIAVLNNPGATQEQFTAAVNETIAEVVASNPPQRAWLIASRIANSQPDLVGLQEAALWTFGTQQFDLLQMILDDLAAQGQNYAAVGTVPEFQINITGLGVGFTDREAILARTDEPALQITRIGQGHYSALIPLPGFPPYLPATNLTRGWGYVDARMSGTLFRFITTHLEDGTNSISPLFALVQALQEIQLVYSPAFTFLPVVIGGDFNTIANDPTSPTFLTYKFMLANGFSDAWTSVHPNLPGLTCCQEDLLDPTPQLTQRLDQVFMRNRVTAAGAQLVGLGKVDDLSWPSDHAAVLAVGAVSRIF